MQLGKWLVCLGLLLPLTTLAEGFYIGGQGQEAIASDNYTLEYAFSGITPPPLAGASFLQSGVHHLPGFSGGLYLGYGQTFHRTYFGVELGGNLGGSKADYNGFLTNGTAYTLTSELKNNFYARFIGGYYFTPKTMLYFGLGGVRATLKTSSAMPASAAPDFPQTNFTRTMSGGSATLGVESLLCKNVTARLQYTYTSYKEFSQASQIALAGGIDSKSARYMLSSNEISLGVAYHFGTDLFKNVHLMKVSDFI